VSLTGNWRLIALLLALPVAVLLTVSGCDDNDPIYGVGGGGSDPAAVVDLEIVLGDLQNGRTSEAFPEPLVVRVTQDLGLVDGVPGTQNIQPVENVEMHWTITKGIATLSNPISFTDADGIASVTVTPGPLLGEIEVTSSATPSSG